WARQRVIDNGDLVVQHIAVGAIQIEPFLDDAPIVPMQREAAVVVDAGACKAASLNLERLVATIPVCIDSSADGQPVQAGLETLRPIATISIHAPAIRMVTV